MQKLAQAAIEQAAAVIVISMSAIIIISTTRRPRSYNRRRPRFGSNRISVFEKRRRSDLQFRLFCELSTLRVTQVHDSMILSCGGYED
jgi:hypothetical protein